MQAVIDPDCFHVVGEQGERRKKKKKVDVPWQTEGELLTSSSIYRRIYGCEIITDVSYRLSCFLQ